MEEENLVILLLSDNQTNVDLALEIIKNGKYDTKLIGEYFSEKCIVYTFDSVGFLKVYQNPNIYDNARYEATLVQYKILRSDKIITKFYWLQWNRTNNMLNILEHKIMNVSIYDYLNTTSRLSESEFIASVNILLNKVVLLRIKNSIVKSMRNKLNKIIRKHKNNKL